MAIAAALVRRTEIAVLFLAALAILLIAPGVISAETKSEGTTEEPIWSADMLVVEYTSVSIGAASADLFSNIGGSADLQIKSLWSHIPDRDLRLSFEDGITDAADYTLQVGDLTLEFPEESSGDNRFKWTEVDVDWEDGQTIPVSIVQTSALEEPEEKEEPAANTPATGAPTISGTAQVDETVMAETSSIADEDGLDGASYSYQWTRSDGSTYADLVGETDSTYTLLFADQGKTIKVRVSFNDDADNEETLTSEATVEVAAAPNRPATGAPTISGTPQVDQTLTAGTSDIADEDGVNDVSYSYQWMADDADIEEATDSTYTPSVSDVGRTIKVKVSFTDDRNNAEARTSLATTAVLATVPTQPLSLTVATGDEIQELDASWQAPSSNGGSSITGYKVQWKRSADSWDTEADVSQATVTGTTHTIPGLTGGVEYAVRVIASNTAGDGPASDEVAGTPAGGTSQQQTGDSTSPTVSSIAITSDTGDEESTWDDDGIYGIGDIISVTVTFSEDVTVKGSPRLELNIGGAAKKAEYKSAVGSKVVFSYTVAEGDSDSDGIAISENKLTLNGGSIKDAADNAADLTHDALAAQADHQVDGVRPTISLVALGYTTGGVVDDTYILGQELPFAVKFSEEVIADGSPQLTLDFDSGPKQATFFYIRLPCLPSEIGASDIVLVSSNGCLTSDTRGLVMVFSYTISMGDEDSDGLGIGANALSANGTISDAAGNEAVLTHEAVADSSNHKIDGVPPEVTSIEIISDPGEDDTYAAGDIIKLNVTFSERLEVLWQYPRLRLDIGDKARMAYRVRRNPLDIRAGEIGYVMAYSYTVQDGDKDDDGISIPANALHRLWGELQDTNGNEVELGHKALASDASHKVATTFVESTDTTAKTGLLTITGTLRVGEIVTADLSNLTDDDGLDYAADSAHYAWAREGGGLYFEAMRDPRYVIAAADKGKKLRVDLQFFDDNGNKEYRRSAWTDPVGLRAPSNNSATGAPTISGTPQVDETLTADTSAISDEDGLSNVSYQYQWLRDGADIAGQTNSTYRLVSADQDKTIKVRVTFRDDADNAESLTSMATTAVAAQPTSLLTASFANVPADHNGGNFTFQLIFSENVDAGYARIRDDAFTVSGGAIASANRITQGSNQGWTVEVDPDGNGSVSITLPETTDCDASGAICTDDSRKLSQSTSATVAGPPAIAVSDATVQEAEGAVLVFTATLSHASSRAVTVDYATSDVTAVAGSDYTAASGTLTFNAGDTSQTVQVTVLTDSEDEGQETLTLTLSNPSQATLDDATGTGTIENGESSSGTQEDPPAEDPPVVSLTATFANMPATHNGSAFTFDLTFSENVNAGYARIRDHAFTVSGATIASASRKEQGSNQGWTVEVDPTGNGSVSITLPETTDCDASGAICTDDSRKLSQSTSATVAGPPAIAVSDATVQEAEGAVLVFTATLSHASSRTVTVDYATSDVTAVAGSDYTAASGTLTFNAGDTSQTVQVTVLTDSEDESQETLTLTLSNPSQATLDDATGTGTIENGESSSGTQEDPPAEDPPEETPVVLLTASFANVPADHDGSNFTFDLTFSEEFGISYVTLQGDAFSVTDGEVTSAQRLTQGSNIGWTITVTPDSAADVTVVLPVTTDCEDEGAVCTADGRKLSNRLEFTVSGPSG